MTKKILEWQAAQKGIYFSDQAITAPLKKGEETYLGYGIDIIHASSYGDTKGPLFKDSVYDNTYGARIIDSASMNEAKVNSVETESFLELFTSFEVDAEVRTGKGVPFFSGGLSVHYGNSRKLEKTARFYSNIVSYCKSKHTLMPAFRSIPNIKKLIQEEVLTDINNAEFAPEELFSCYGTHLIQEAIIGGSAKITAIYDSSTEIKKNDLKAAIDLACSYVSMKTDVKFSEEQKKVLSNTEIRGFCQGGNTTLIAGLTSFTLLPKFLQEWGASLRNTEDLAPADILKYRPIWDLAEDKTRQKALEDEFFKQARETGNKLAKYFIKAVSSEQVAMRCQFSGQASMWYIGTLNEELLKKNTQSKEIIEALSKTCIMDTLQVTKYNKCRKIENEDHTFSFSFDNEDNQFLSVYYNSNLLGLRGADAKQLFANGQSITDREKFALEPYADGYKMKSIHTGKYVKFYDKQLIAGARARIALADAEAADASVFKFVKL